MRHPCTPTIPHDGLVATNKTCGVKNKNPNASADTNPGDGTGSAWFRVNAWCMQWGQRYAVTRPWTAPQFTSTPTLNSWFPHSINLAFSLYKTVFLSTHLPHAGFKMPTLTYMLKFKKTASKDMCENKTCWHYLQYMLKFATACGNENKHVEKRESASSMFNCMW